jgi:hypothetical protein
LPFIRPEDPSIIGKQAIDFAFDIGRLSPDAAAAAEPPDLIEQFTKEDMATVVPRPYRVANFVCLIDRVDRRLNIPKAAIK